MREFCIETIMTPEYNGLFDEAKISVVEQMNQAYGVIRDLLMLENIKENMVEYGDIPTVHELFNTISGSALVVAGGPSTARNIENIRKAQDTGATIVAIDRVLWQLKQNGIVPDITITADTSYKVEPFFECVEPGDKVCVFMAQHPDVLKRINNSGGTMYGHMQNLPSSKFAMDIFNGVHDSVSVENQVKLKKYYGLRGEHVVTTLAIDLAYWMGAETVMVIGNELSWNCKEEMADDHKKLFEGNTIDVDLIDGTKKITASVFLHTAYGVSFFLWKYKDCDFVDLSNGIMQGWQSSDFEIELIRMRSEL